jgi:hypothetical protein
MIRSAMVSLAILVCCTAARADVAMAWSGGIGIILVAHDGKIEGFDRTGAKLLWSAQGLDSPSAIVMSADGTSAAVLDGFADRIAVVSVADGKAELYETPTTPIAATFFGRDLWIALRDRSRVLRITPKGEKTEVDVALDPSHIAASDQFVYAYSRASGMLQEIDPAAAQVTRKLTIGTAGSDFEVRPVKPGDRAGAMAYLCRPANGMIVAIDLVPLKGRDIKAGFAAPVDLAFVPFGARLSLDPGTSVIADPGKQALLIAKDPRAGRALSPPTAVDRVLISEAGLFAFDSNSGTVYRVDEKTATKIASGQTATSFVPTSDALFTWDAKAGKPRRENIVR